MYKNEGLKGNLIYTSEREMKKEQGALYLKVPQEIGFNGNIKRFFFSVYSRQLNTLDGSEREDYPKHYKVRRGVEKGISCSVITSCA